MAEGIISFDEFPFLGVTSAPHVIFAFLGGLLFLRLSRQSSRRGLEVQKDFGIAAVSGVILSVLELSRKR